MLLAIVSAATVTPTANTVHHVQHVAKEAAQDGNLSKSLLNKASSVFSSTVSFFTTTVPQYAKDVVAAVNAAQPTAIAPYTQYAAAALVTVSPYALGAGAGHFATSAVSNTLVGSTSEETSNAQNNTTSTAVQHGTYAAVLATAAYYAATKNEVGLAQLASSVAAGALAKYGYDLAFTPAPVQHTVTPVKAATAHA